MNKTVFHIAKMDCPSEEKLIRLKLESIPGILSITADFEERKLSVIHEGPQLEIKEALDELTFGTSIIASDQVEEITNHQNKSKERRILWTVLFINVGFFVLEMLTGLISKSMGLIADSLDMLSDSFVYGLSLYAVGTAVARKKKIARLSGYFQLLLALIGFAEVIRRFLGYADPPDFTTMIIVSILALAGNAVCLFLLQQTKSTEAHMKASMIFTSNDIIVNLGVIAAAILVYLTSSNKPDLVIGGLVFIVVIRGAFRILKIAK
jgi:Co/Zn/Cd efflux system component